MPSRLGFLVLALACKAAAQDPAAEPAACALLPPPVLSKAEALQRVRSCNREVIAARRIAQAAGAGVQIASQPPNPVATMGVGSYNWRLGIGPGPVTDKAVDTSVRVEQLLERGDKLALRTAAAELLAAAARADVLDVERQQATATLQAMVDLAAATARVVLLDDLLRLYDDTAAANARRLARGDVARIDVQRQAIEAGRTRTDLIQARGDLQRARLSLSILLAWEGHAGALQADAGILERYAVEALPPADDRPDVQAARLRMQAAATARGLARAQQKADVTVGLQFDHYPTSATNTNGSGNTVGLTVSMPLLVRHRYQGDIARATSEFYAAQDAVARAAATASADQVRVAQELEAARARLELLVASQAPQAEDVLRAAEAGYARGALGVLDVLEARRTARQVRVDILAARADAARAALAHWWWDRQGEVP